MLWRVDKENYYVFFLLARFLDARGERQKKNSSFFHLAIRVSLRRIPLHEWSRWRENKVRPCSFKKRTNRKTRIKQLRTLLETERRGANPRLRDGAAPPAAAAAAAEANDVDAAEVVLAAAAGASGACCCAAATRPVVMAPREMLAAMVVCCFFFEKRKNDETKKKLGESFSFLALE